MQHCSKSCHLGQCGWVPCAHLWHSDGSFQILEGSKQIKDVNNIVHYWLRQIMWLWYVIKILTSLCWECGFVVFQTTFQMLYMWKCVTLCTMSMAPYKCIRWLDLCAWFHQFSKDFFPSSNFYIARCWLRQLFSGFSFTMVCQIPTTSYGIVWVAMAIEDCRYVTLSLHCAARWIKFTETPPPPHLHIHTIPLVSFWYFSGMYHGTITFPEFHR